MKCYHMKWLSIISFILIFTFLFVFKDQVPLVFANNEGEEKQIEKTELSHEQIVNLTDEFLDVLVQETEDKYRVVDMDTKEQLLKEFDKITTREVASEYVDFYYQEKADGLYLKPTESPPWFIKENNYDRIKVDNNTIKIVQNNDFDLYGSYTIEIEFTYDADWKITNVTHK